ncbi:hypothetical protein ACEXQB_012925 [Herbiconiux sp. P18]|uniref:MmyB family transcriptional regulator n=1 Tax=Herbiconiux liangxiaofengii TaxID=3342795 RepID=UPI0035B9F9AB
MTRSPSPRDGLHHLVEAIENLPVVAHDRHLTVIDSNALARALTPFFEVGVNLARSAFLDESVGHGEPTWPALAEDIGAGFRLSLDRHEADDEFRSVIGELAAQSRSFSEVFARDSSSVRGSGAWTFRPGDGPPLTLVFHRLPVPGDEHDTLLVWRAADAASERGLAALAAGAARASD